MGIPSLSEGSRAAAYWAAWESGKRDVAVAAERLGRPIHHVVDQAEADIALGQLAAEGIIVGPTGPCLSEEAAAAYSGGPWART